MYGENERIEIKAGNREITLSAVTELILSGGTAADVMNFMESPGMRKSLTTLDRTRFGGISAQTSATRVQAYMDAPDPSQGGQETAPVLVDVNGEQRQIEEVLVIGQRPGSGGDIARSAVSGGWELADSFTQLYDRDPRLAGLATTAIGVALGGAPKAIFKRIGGEAADQAISKGAEAFGSVVGSAVSALAARKGWVIGLTIAGLPTQARAEGIGLAAGAVASGAVQLGLGAGAGAIAATVKKVHLNARNSGAFTSLYRLADDSGNLLKWGVTSRADPTRRYSKSYMSDKRMDVEDTGTRSEMLDRERGLVETDPGPLNKEPWAGSKRDKKR